MTSLVKQGYAILMISSELPELLGMCDRLYVMSQGRMAGVLTRDEFSQDRIMQMAVSNLEK